MTNKFSSEVADKLLDKLSSDQKFRDLFEKNPRAALKSVGHETPDANRDSRGEDPVMCCNLGPKGLASMDAIRAGREKMKAALVSTQQHTIFSLSAD
jgi:putative modified peptide